MDPHVEVEIARRYLVGAWQTCNGAQGAGSLANWSTAKFKPWEGNGTEFQQKWQTLPTRILAASPHLQGYDVPGEEIDRLKAEGLTLLEALERLGIA